MSILKVGKGLSLVFFEEVAVFGPEGHWCTKSGERCQQEEQLSCCNDVHMPFGEVEACQTKVEAPSNLNSSALRTRVDAGLWLEGMLPEYMADS